ncbi:helix-turn-helix transcriptional regulator [Frankia sp. AgB1.9]|uniref:TetR/AcrR family transcriptional regulator n=1 Tax=unclassified Frankia TaxID=2632575 RepID=UPI0019348D58|nr:MULTISPECIES: TetR/AcrR family transcriptional regulator [unclassified Frankia]MBL7488844.1 helix-turn-helix transcriptional regulator [Frankia sp. AgW1.1]MBL7546488.1 helix-turn-helix transcriptional regulator [Frankia sp. AgB1.9]MBL7620253.1 helix-turn-helix transcriptional regulator [Frankia sp. AgB1.8]
MAWTDRAADWSPSVQRSRGRTIAQATGIVEAARRLLRDKGRDFTTQELAREAGVALQTFYRHFPSKDHLLAAVIEEEIAEKAERMAAAARDLPDPVARLRSYVETTLASIQNDATGETDPAGLLGPRFVTAEHWRLRQRLPEDMDRAIQPMIDLIGREVAAARAAGLLRPTGADRDASLVTMLLMTVFHHYAYAPLGERPDGIVEHVWDFCLTGLGGGGSQAGDQPTEDRNVGQTPGR